MDSVKISNKANAKRRFPTQETAMVEIYGRPGEQTVARMKNLSETGAFLEWLQTEDHIHAGDLLRVTVVLNHIGKKRLVSASVIWTNAAGVGVQFVPSEQIVEFLTRKSSVAV